VAHRFCIKTLGDLLTSELILRRLALVLFPTYLLLKLRERLVESLIVYVQASGKPLDPAELLKASIDFACLAMEGYETREAGLRSYPGALELRSFMLKQAADTKMLINALAAVVANDDQKNAFEDLMQS